ncbi:inhibitor of nuclear factor kappa-B kinase-interacting protein-like isoform X1 [Acipenser ruthenus]|uniref:inhibitor of nuclear factor kappa-B kinase-interacting protein-like isoform X1 n=1 Tax=Acipenser ruthenus TaxID=7906 RepID=UPI0027423838|nr:inhibitor of nuclear factor kappa-B kinase-interacting protein-like isoform X1 [Acipenser ruthenus]
MPSNEVKQRKKTTPSGKQNEETEEKTKLKEEKVKQADLTGKTENRVSSSGVDIKTVTCLLSLIVSLALAWFVLQQAKKFADVEEKYNELYKKTRDIQSLENEINQVSKKLESSEEDLQEALSSVSLVTTLEHDVSGLQTIINVMQDSERSVSQNMQNINERFQNVTDLWKSSLDQINLDIGNLKSETRVIHNKVTTKINEAEKNLKMLSVALEDLEDSTKRNSRVLQRNEDEEVVEFEKQLDWNTRQIQKLEEQGLVMVNKDSELMEKLADYQPKMEKCEEQLPTVENAVTSILKMSSELINTEKRIEDLTVQVFNMEDNMLKVVSEILEIKKDLDILQVDNSILKLANELKVLKETVKEFDRAQKEMPVIQEELNTEL